MLRRFAWLQSHAPELFDSLSNVPRSEASGIDHFHYWSRETFGLKPVTSLTRVSILRTAVDGRQWTFVASSRSINHYFEASLGLTVIAEESAGAVSVAYFNRMRGWLASVQRTPVERRVRKAMERNLLEMKLRLEPVGFAVQNFAKFLGHSLAISRGTVSGSESTASEGSRLTGIQDLENRYVPR